MTEMSIANMLEPSQGVEIFYYFLSYYFTFSISD